MSHNKALETPTEYSPGSGNLKLYGQKDNSRAIAISLFVIFTIGIAWFLIANKNSILPEQIWQIIGGCVVLYLIPLSIFISGSRPMSDEQRRVIDKMHEGKHAKGTIIDIETHVIKIGRNQITKYTYVVEVVDPDSGGKAQYNSQMFSRVPSITKKDLPLKASVYLKGKVAYVDEFTSAPVNKINKRDLVKTIAIIAFISGLVLSVGLGVSGYTISGIITLAVGVIIGLGYFAADYIF